ncbi:helix-turn-helix domain-containing protein [Rhodohalobacter barkolensis]|uniref:HTH araC/xylS-type domain-containing protein n=1 Tax=Rhodohalobacter barkolensis TaxID=2053187 RepID=A0A2N0VHR0_9BACT|nr:AraC family transcriptional regulator [Rhodohalobacter barkolensis]PKD43731.1 hypothetical protein CWD77_09230 [Rhodohalobacter barkolensis]
MSGSANNDGQNRNLELLDTSGTRKLYVKYMVCLRDRRILKSILDDIGFNYEITFHGAIHFLEEYTDAQYDELKKSLSETGMILLTEKESTLIDRIIHTIVEVIHHSETLPKLSFHDLVNKHVISGEDSVFKIFSDVNGMSVIQFIVIQKIERAKELMLYEDMPIDDIAEVLNYKNKHYLIAQFKKTTGLTPRYFMRLKKERQNISKNYSHSPTSGVGGVSS